MIEDPDWKLKKIAEGLKKEEDQKGREGNTKVGDLQESKASMRVVPARPYYEIKKIAKVTATVSSLTFTLNHKHQKFALITVGNCTLQISR